MIACVGLYPNNHNLFMDSLFPMFFQVYAPVGVLTMFTSFFMQ